VGKADIITKKYMADNNVFADAFNYLIYGGRQVIKPENLTPLDTTIIGIPFGIEGKNTPIQKFRDEFKNLVIKKDDKAVYLVLGIENQTELHYAMPVKNMVYDALEYAAQVTRTAAAHRKNKDKSPSNAEYLSGFFRTDKLIPVITLTVYFGVEKWDAPTSIFDMFPEDTEKELLALTENYKINLITPEGTSDEELDKFHSSLREVLKYIKYSRDKKKITEIVNGDEKFSRLERSAFDVINTCTSSKLKVKGNEEVVNMCQAIIDIKEDAKNEGKLEGRLEGISEGVTKVALNLIKSGKMSLEEIANITELSLDEIKKIASN